MDDLDVVADGMRVARNVDVPMRDGVALKADVFRPLAKEPQPVLISMGPYQKNKLWEPPPDLDEPANPYMNWETVNPVWWTSKDYVVVRLDSRGTGESPGKTALGGLQHAQDFHDAIEWAAAQAWCTGRVGTIGISFYAISQWHVANLQPPSLKAMIPWEGAADYYRDARYHGGLFCQNYVSTWFVTHMAHHLLGRASRRGTADRYGTNTLHDVLSHSLDDGYYRHQQVDWTRLTIPFLSAGNWSGMALHLRGNLEAYVNAVNAPRKLRMHSGTHYHPFYSHEGKAEQLRFLDHWLKGVQNGVMDEPPIKLGVREGEGRLTFRFENEWPLARTQWTKFYLRPPTSAGASPRLACESLDVEASITYSASGTSRAGRASASSTSVTDGALANSGVSFLTDPLATDVEVTGPMVLRLWVESSTEDMDIFVTLRDIGADGKDVFEVGQQGYPVPIAKGWLRVSHRALDPEKSLPWRPFHLHTSRDYVEPGQIVQVDVEVWPTSMIFRQGHRIRVDIQPRDGIGSGAFTHYVADYNDGTNTLHFGGRYDAHLLLPIIPAAEAMSGPSRSA